MPTATLTRSEIIDPFVETQQHNDHRFFDPRSPEKPQQILGIDTEAILRLGRAATALGALPPRVNIGLNALPYAVRLMPLVQEMQSGAAVTPEDIRPYRKPIKKLSMVVGFADKAAAMAGVLAVGIPLRRALNRKIEREFPVRASEAIENAREAVAGIEREVDFVASFENPREQFVGELNELAEMVRTAISEQRDIRVRHNVSTTFEHELPKGIMGFFTKAIRNVKSFFGFCSHKSQANSEITAYDAGAGIEITINSLTHNSDSSVKRLPMLSRLVLGKLPNNMQLTKDRLALAAPEILNFLFSTSTDNDEANQLLDSVNRNPHELRFVTRFKKHYGRYSLDGIQRASRTLIPAIRDVLPAEGSKVRDIYTQAQDLLQSTKVRAEVELTPELPKIKQKGLRCRLKSRFGKSHKQ